METNSSTLTGLSDNEVLESRKKHGDNILTPPMRDPWWKLYLEKFSDPIIRILLIAAAIAIGVGFIDGKFIEGIGIIIAIFLATFVAFINEFNAKKEFDILNKVNDDVPIQVIRNSVHTVVPKKDIVVGDIVILETGKEVPADGILIEAVSLQIDEAKLTGESFSVAKYSTQYINNNKIDQSKEAYPLDQVLRDTIVSDGHGTVKVAAVGDKTEIGKTARSAAEESNDDSPLTKQLDKLGKLIGVLGFSIAGAIYIALIVRGIIVREPALNLSAQQWTFSIIFMISVLIALAKVWMPICYDAMNFIGWEMSPPEWLDSGGLKTWGILILISCGFFGVCAFGGGIIGVIAKTPAEWMPIKAGEEFLNYFMIVITIIVVAVPEGLPLSTTLSLAYSMRKMTATNNLVRKMLACETIGAVNVICSDKTGTLTMNLMDVKHAQFEGFDTNSDISLLIFESMAVNSTANLGNDADGNVSRIGNPTECALLLWMKAMNEDYLDFRANFKIEKQWTFTTERKFMATLGVSKDGIKRLYMKGAPEIILEDCDRICHTDGVFDINEEKAEVMRDIQLFQSKGMRVLGFAYKEGDVDTTKDASEISHGAVWIGFVSIADPVRPEVKDAVMRCINAGIDIKMVTGDNSETAKEIGNEIDLFATHHNWDNDHISGKDFSLLDHEDAKTRANGIVMMSRAKPGDKLRLVRLLKELGKVVAVTGDGTNDGPALNQASVGLSMGTGSAVAKEASDIILLDDSFSSIVNAVMWGRTIYLNIQKFIIFQLTVNVVALGVALLGPFIGIKFPLTVIQMLWVNLIMDTFAALALATEPPDWKLMENKPRNINNFIVTPEMAKFIFEMGLVFLAVLVVFIIRIQSDNNVTPREMTLFFTTFVMLQFWNLFNAKGFGKKESVFHNFIGNRGFILIATIIFLGQVFIVQFGGEVMRTVPISLKQWMIIIAATSPVLFIGELKRIVFTKKS